MTYYPLLSKKSSQPVLHPKLKIGAPGDWFEREADAVADRVMRMQDDESLRMQPLEEEEELMQMQPLEEEEKMMMPKVKQKAEGNIVAAELVKVSISEEEKNNASSLSGENEQPQSSGTKSEDKNEVVQAKSNSDLFELSSGFQNAIASLKGSGQPLSPDTNQFMSSALGADFDDIRIHNDQKSSELNDSIQSRAFTYGQDIYFNQGEYKPNSYEGGRLLAHELTHSIQQGAVPSIGDNRKKSDGGMVNESVQRAIDTSILLHTYSLNALNNAMGRSGNGVVDANLRRIESSAISSFGSRNPVLNMNVEDKWYYYADSFAFGCPTRSTTSQAAAILQNCAWEYYNADDEYNVTFTFRHTATRSRQGQFATASGRTRSQTITLTGGAKLTYSIVELSASASQATTSGSSSTTTVTATNFYEHDYDVSIAYNVSYYESGDFRINSDFFPGMDQVGGPHTHSGTANIGSITVYDDDRNPDNLTP